MDYTRELEVALHAAKVAGEYLKKAYLEFQALADAPANISTEADRNSQELILQILAKEFPEDRLCAEESTSTLSKSNESSSRMWVVDPIDGTRGFVMKNGEFSVMIGLVDRDKIVVGVVLEPAFDRITYSRLNSGCWVLQSSDAPRRCKVRDESTISGSILVQSHAKKGPSETQKMLSPSKVVETYSAGVKLAMVARGEVDVYVNTYPNFRDWDICAGQLLVEEAGGKVSEIDGAAITYGKVSFAQKGGLIATNGVIHRECVAKLQGIELV